MKIIKPDISQIIFSLTFIFCLTFTRKGLGETTFIYSFFLWVWLTFITRKTIKHPMGNKYGEILNKINTKLTIMTIGGVFIFTILSISFLARIIFGRLYIYEFIKYGTPFVFIISIIVNIYIATKNILIIDKTSSVSKIICSLLIYPIGVWTIQETLKKK